MHAPKEWLLDEKYSVEERIEELESYHKEEKADGYLATANFLRKYITMIDAELLHY